MISNSIILSFMLTLLHGLKDAYYNSAVAKVINRFSVRFKSLFAGSAIWGFVKRSDFFTRLWEHSAIFKALDWIINVPTKSCRKLYSKFKDAVLNSYTYKILELTLHKFEVLIALFFVLIFIVPHDNWNNLYNTLIVFGLVFLYFIKTILHKYERFNFKAMDFALFVFMLCVLLATVLSIFPKSSIKFLLFHVTCFMVVLLIVSVIKTVKALSMMIQIMLIGITITGLYGIYQSIIGIPVDPALTDVTLNEGLGGRVYSTMGNANNYAEILILTLPFYLAVILNSKTMLKKLAFIALAIPPFVSLLLTLSRSAWISFAAGIMVFVFFKNRKLIPLFIIAAILCFPYLPEPIYRRILTISNPNDTSAAYRVQIYKTVLPMLKDYWIAGVGLGTDVFMKICQGYYLHTVKTPPHTHNLLLQVWIETGLLGILSFVWFLVRTVKKCMIDIFNKVDESISNILGAGVASITAILIMGMAEYVWYYPRTMLTFWAIVGIILASLSILAVRKSGLSVSGE